MRKNLAFSPLSFIFGTENYRFSIPNAHHLNRNNHSKLWYRD